LKEKDSLLRSAEDSLAEARSQNENLSKELDEARITLEKKSERFDRESKALVGDLFSNAMSQEQGNTKH
jgi:hypothetical protein